MKPAAPGRAAALLAVALLLGGWAGGVAAAAPRLASLSPGLTEVVYALGAADALVGVSRQCDYPVAAKLKPKVGDFNQPDPGRLAAAGAELVLLSEQVRPRDLEALAAAGIATRVVPAASLTDVWAAVRELGELTGRGDAARALEGRLRAAVDEVRARVASLKDEERPRVYVEVDGPPQLYAVGPGSFMDEVVRLAGGRNAFAAAAAPYLPVSDAEVRAAAPEVILVDHPFQYKVGVAKRPGWGDLAAVRSGRVYDGTDFDIVTLNRPGPRIVESLREVSRLLHPERWRDR